MKQRFDAQNPMQVGGQAVIEGVMMRAPGMIATAVRRANGRIAVRKDRFVSLAERNPLFKLPVLRGAAGLIEMLVIGIRTLNFSAEMALEDAEPEPRDNGSNGDGSLPAAKRSRAEQLRLGLTVLISMVAGLALFFFTPLLLTTSLFTVEQDPLRFNIIAGAMRIALMLLYLFVISLMKDVRRLFAYHGAEHKAVFAFERGVELTVPAARAQSRFHPRCGTSFLLVVMFVAILLFGLVDTFLIAWVGKITLVSRVLVHLPLIPLVGGISYEGIKLSAKRSTTRIGKIIVAPGLWLQRITTQEPDEQQLEVALVALRCALGREQVALPSGEVPSEFGISVN